MTHPGPVNELSETRVAAEQAVRNAVVAQLDDEDPHHLDFAAWGQTLEMITRRLAELSQTMSAQIRDYGTRRLLLDAEGADPAARLAMAAGHLDGVHRAMQTAHEAAQGFRAEITQVGVAVDPDAERRMPRNEIDHEVMPFWPGLTAKPQGNEDDG